MVPRGPHGREKYSKSCWKGTWVTQHPRNRLGTGWEEYGVFPAAELKSQFRAGENVAEEQELRDLGGTNLETQIFEASPPFKPSDGVSHPIALQTEIKGVYFSSQRVTAKLSPVPQ